MEISLLDHQYEFIFSTAKHTGLIGGYGCGKTFSGLAKTLLKKLQYPNINVAYYLPTYALINDIAVEKFPPILEMFGISYSINHSKKEIATPYGKIIMRSMDKPESIVGYEVGYSLIDETDILPTHKMKDVFSKIIGRNRLPLPNGDVNCTDVVGTPEGFKWAYDFFVKQGDRDGRRLIKGKTKDNPFLPEGYITTLLDVYDEKQLEAYLNGEFVNLTSGNVYRNYNRIENRTRRTVQAGDVIHIGMDFNITKMNAVVHIEEGDLKYAVDEFANAYDTQELCELIRRKYAGHKIIIYPDSAGKSRSTSGKSDHDIIRSFGFVIRAGVRNPFVKDRVNKMNLSFKDHNGNISYFVNDEQCPVYAEALEKQTYKNGEPDKNSGFDHITEAGGYYIYNCDKKLTYKAG